MHNSDNCCRRPPPNSGPVKTLDIKINNIVINNQYELWVYEKKKTLEETKNISNELDNELFFLNIFFFFALTKSFFCLFAIFLNIKNYNVQINSIYFVNIFLNERNIR